jgi:hypothetical protein
MKMHGPGNIKKGKAVPIWTYTGSQRYTTSRLHGFPYNWHMKAEHTTSKVTGDLSGTYSVHSSNENNISTNKYTTVL